MSRNLRLLALANLVAGLSEGLFVNFQPLYLQMLGADLVRIGAVLSGLGLMMTVASIPAGYLADRIGRKPLLVSAWLTGTLAIMLMSLAESLPLFVLGVLLFGAGNSVSSLWTSYATVARGQWSAGRAITFVAAGYQLGMVFGPWLGGWIGDQWGLRLNLALAAGVHAVSTALVFLVQPQAVQKAPPGESGWALLRLHRYRVYLTILVVAGFALYLPQPLSPNFLQNERALDLTQIGTLYALTAAGGVVLNLILGRMPMRAGFMLGQAAVLLFALLVWRGPHVYWYALGYFLLGGYKTARSLGLGQVSELVGPAKLGVALGIAQTVTSLGGLLAPLVASWLYLQDPTWMYVASIGLIAFSLAISVLMTSTPKVASRRITEDLE
jgi:MFS family permease